MSAPANIGTLLRFLLWVAFVMAAGAGCGEDRLESEITGVAPTVYFPNQSLPLEIKGHFVTRVSASAQTGDVTEDTSFSAKLIWRGPLETQPLNAPASYPLENVTFVDHSTLRAMTPASMVPGYYQVEVVDPRGRTSNRSDIVTVDDAWPDHAVLSGSRQGKTNEDIPIHIQLVGADGVAYPYPGTVEVTIQSTDAYIVEYTLTGAMPDRTVEGYPVIRGQVAGDGSATIELRAPTAGSYQVMVQSIGLQHFRSDDAFQLNVISADFDSLLVEIPGGAETFATSAGAPFGLRITALDLYKQPITGVEGPVEIYDLSGRLVLPPMTATLKNGTWSGNVVLFQAEETQLIAVGPDSKIGISPRFDVVPGPPRFVNIELDTASEANEVMAGERFGIHLLQTDAYGNPVDIVAPATSILVGDKTDTLECGAPDIGGSAAWLTGCRVTRAQAQNFVHAAIEKADGTSRLFEVYPGPLAGFAVELSTDAVVAGEPFEVEVTARDVYGNRVSDIDGDVSVSDVPFLSDPELEQPFELPLIDGIGVGQITLTRVVDKTRLHASSELLGVHGDSPSFPVVAGIPSHFRIDVPTVLVAGQAASAELRALDAYGNVVADYQRADITLTCSSGESIAATVQVGDFINGVATATFTLNKAGSGLSLSAAAGDGIEGTSNLFDVVAGKLTQFELAEPLVVVWKDEPFELEIRAVDSLGNIVETFNNAVRVTDLTGTFQSLETGGMGLVEVGPFVKGVYRARFQIRETNARNKLVISYPGEDGATTFSDSFVVYSTECISAPEASISVGGGATVACLDSATFYFVATTSLPQVYDYVWDFDDGQVTHDPTKPRMYHTYTGIGQYHPRVAVVDDKLCARWVDTTVYVGNRDRTPAGPLVLKADSTTLNAGYSDGSQYTGISARAYDCAGDSIAADGKSLLTVQSSLGVVRRDGSSSSVFDADPDQQGLQFPIGQTSKPSFGVNVGGSKQGGTAEVVVAYIRDGLTLAAGRLELTVANDATQPYVVQYWPHGNTRGTITEIGVTFNEPLHSTALEQPAISARGSSGRVYTFTRALSSDNRTLVLTLTTPIDLDAEPDTITVTLPSISGKASLKDPYGNRLDGNWDRITQEVDSFVWRFGDLPPAGSGGAQRCDVDEVLFSPDGQDGPAFEADTTQLEAGVFAELGLRAYAVEIADSRGTPVAWVWRPFSGDVHVAEVLETWDGRGMSGLIQPNGIYPFTIWTVDVNDNWMSSLCAPEETSEVEIRSPIDLGEYP